MSDDDDTDAAVVEEELPEFKAWPVSDLGNAYRLRREFGDRFRFNSAMGWLHYPPRGGIWTPDDSNALNELAGQAVQRLLHEDADRAYRAGMDEGTVKGLLGGIKRAQSAAAITAALRLWRPLQFQAAVDFDQHPRLVTVQNGVLELETRTPRPFDASLLCTRMMPVVHDPSAEAPFFTKTLEYFVPDKDVRDYLQRLFGYCLTGEIGEQQFTVFYGAGANGKSTLLEAIRQVFGRGSERGFSHEADPRVFEPRRSGSSQNADPERFKLMGLRLVTPIENDAELRLDAPFIKALTGGEAITARDLYHTSVTFKPSFKLIFATNHEPRIDDDSEGMWRRVHKVDFEVRIPEEHRSPWEVVIARLATERAGILNWCLDGFDEWRKHGLCAPPQVTLSSKEMRLSQDRLGLFLTETVVHEEGQTLLRGDLWKVFCDWRRGDSTLASIGRTEFYARMAKRLGEPDARGYFQHVRLNVVVPY